MSWNLLSLHLIHVQGPPCPWAYGKHTHTDMRIWAHGHIIEWTYGVALTWDINSYAHVQQALTTQVQASNLPM